MKLKIHKTESLVTENITDTAESGAKQLLVHKLQVCIGFCNVKGFCIGQINGETFTWPH